MKAFYSFFATGLVLLFHVVTGQSISFKKNYQVWNEFAMHNFQQTSDGGYIISTDAMWEMDSLSSLGRGFLVKTDNMGNTQWIKEYIKTGSSVKPKDGCAVFQCSDGGYIVTGAFYQFNGNSVMRLIRTDASGNYLWSKIYPGLGVSSGNCVRQTADGGYIVAGSTANPMATFTSPYILKTDASGNTLFGKIFTDSNGYTGGAYSVKQCNNGNYIFCGSSAYQPFIGKMDSQGNLLWEKRLNSITGYGGEFYDVIEDNSGNYTCTGRYETSLSLVNFNSSGAVNWSKFFGSGETGYSLKETGAGSLVVSSSSNSGESLLLLFNGNGNFTWGKNYGMSGSILPNVAEVTSDGGFALYANNSTYSIYILKTNNEGAISCGQNEKFLSEVFLSFQLSSPLAISDNLLQLSDTLTFHSRTLTEDVNCRSDSIPHIPPSPCEDSVFIPNVFTPNGDQQNDVFADYTVSCDTGYFMRIYDRWGAIVFENRAKTIHWDGRTGSGTPSSEGTYYYILTAGKKTFKGYLTLLR